MPRNLAMRCEVGMYNASMPGSKEFTAALNFCDRALQIDNSNVFALTGMTFKYINPVILAQSRDPQGDIRQADEFVSQARAIDPNSYWAHFAKAYVLMGQNRTQEAVVEGDRGAFSLNPSFINAYFALCAANNFLGRPDRTPELADKAIGLSPRDPALSSLYHTKGWAFFMKQQDDQAIEWLRRAEGGIFHGTHTRRGACVDRLAASRCPRDAQTLPARSMASPARPLPELKQQLSIADNPTWVAYNERVAGLRKAGCRRTERHARVYDDTGSTSISRMRSHHVAFCWSEKHPHPDLAYAAQYLACTSPCERFAFTAFVIVDEAGQALNHQEK